MTLKMTVSRETLDDYIELLVKWNKTINLISDATIDKIRERHIEDSLQLTRYIPDKKSRIIDLGAGAGLPGMVLAICGYECVTLIESDSRKTAFLRQAKSFAPTTTQILNDRIEKLQNLSCDIIVSRAFASLEKIFRYSQHITVSDKYLLHKGENYQKEIDEASANWLFTVKIHDSVTSSKGKILEIANLRPKM